MDATLTGANYAWDYSQLAPTGQRVDSFFPESAGNVLLTIYFSNTPFNANRSNLSSPGSDFTLGSTISVANVYNYYYNTSSAYSQVGMGAEVNGVPLPIVFNPHDRIYQLPMTYNQRDSVTFQYGLDLTSTIGIYYNVRKTRKNFVDGWGSLLTPFRSYNCLRVKTQITEIDSIHIDSLGFGFSTPAITTYEYKWLATGERVPVLQINTTANGAVSSIAYKDSPVGIPSFETTVASVNVFPNPVTDRLNINIRNFSGKKVKVKVTGSSASESGEFELSVRSTDDVQTIDLSSFASGIYLISIADESGKTLTKTVVKR
jgi:hypothetical protein